MCYFSLLTLFIAAFISTLTYSQVVINEGSNRNYSNIADENGEYPDWIELYNASTTTVSLHHYSLTDNINKPTKWVFPNVKMQPGEYRTIFCSDKDRKPVSGFIHVLNTGTYTPQVGWNTHTFTTPFYWDGVSNILVNVCSYSSVGYTSNSVFNQSPTTYWSTAFHFQDGSDASCYTAYGGRVALRPNMKLNGHVIGTGQIQNSPYDYPAPYGNWYWGARHQMLITAAELNVAGLPAGYINSLAFDVVSTDPNTVYDYIDVHMRLVTIEEVSSEFMPVDTNNFLHTNFKISEDGETLFLLSPAQVILSELDVNCGDLDNSIGRFPDMSTGIYLFQRGTPAVTNNNSATFANYLLPPSFSMPSGFYDAPFSVTINNPNPGNTSVHYTTDGSELHMLSPSFTGEVIQIHISTITPETYPWQGVYFNGIPVQIEAIANEEYSFLHWGNNGLISDTLNTVFNGLLNADEVGFEAYFDDLTTGVPACTDEPQFSVFPNPAGNFLYINKHEILQNDAHYQIIDINGRVVMESFVPKGNSTLKIDVHSLMKSVNLLKVNLDDGNSYQYKFVKI